MWTEVLIATIKKVSAGRDNEKRPPKPCGNGGQVASSVALRKNLEGGCGDAHKGRVGVDARSGAGLAHGGPCGDPQHGNSGEIGPACTRQPSDVLRPVCKALLPLWRRPCGHIARCQGEQGQTARRRVSQPAKASARLAVASITSARVGRASS